MKNYYEILEVNENATPEIINKVFKIHIKKNHPDLVDGEEKIKAEEKMKEINEAYDVLSDEEKRKQYDDTLKAQRELESQNIQEQQELELLREENHTLRSELLNKEQIIRHFLGGLDLTEYEHPTTTVHNTVQDVSYTNPQVAQSEEQAKYAEEHPVKYYMKYFLKRYGWTIFRVLFSIILVILGFALIGKITHTDIFQLIYDVFNQSGT